jgi:hypothetical protein
MADTSNVGQISRAMNDGPKVLRGRQFAGLGGEGDQHAALLPDGQEAFAGSGASQACCGRPADPRAAESETPSPFGLGAGVLLS